MRPNDFVLVKASGFFAGSFGYNNLKKYIRAINFAVATSITASCHSELKNGIETFV